MILSDYLNQHDVSDRAFAERIGVSRQALHRYRTGQRTPKPPVMKRIREATGGAVAADDFISTAETAGRTPADSAAVRENDADVNTRETGGAA